MLRFVDLRRSVPIDRPTTRAGVPVEHDGAVDPLPRAVRCRVTSVVHDPSGRPATNRRPTGSTGGATAGVLAFRWYDRQDCAVARVLPGGRLDEGLKY